LDRFSVYGNVCRHAGAQTACLHDMAGQIHLEVTVSATRLGPVEVRPEYQAEQLVPKMGIEIVRCEPGLVIGSMPVQGNRQPVGIMHGGANAVLAETLGSLAAWLHAGKDGQAVGLDGSVA
jgi:1,4-dihydroxy-2-naphthoyl-CoA hydrolase